MNEDIKKLHIAYTTEVPSYKAKAHSLELGKSLILRALEEGEDETTILKNWLALVGETHRGVSLSLSYFKQIFHRHLAELRRLL